jgi:hypothetical protein
MGAAIEPDPDSKSGKILVPNDDHNSTPLGAPGVGSGFVTASIRQARSLAPAGASIGEGRRPACCLAVLGYWPQEPGGEEDTVAWGLPDQPLPIPPGNVEEWRAGGRAGPSSPTGSVWPHPGAALTMARIPVRIALGRLDQAAATSLSRGSAGAVGSTTGSTCPGSWVCSVKSLPGSGLRTGLHLPSSRGRRAKFAVSRPFRESSRILNRGIVWRSVGHVRVPPSPSGCLGRWPLLQADAVAAVESGWFPRAAAAAGPDFQ